MGMSKLDKVIQEESKRVDTLQREYEKAGERLDEARGILANYVYARELVADEDAPAVVEPRQL